MSCVLKPARGCSLYAVRIETAIFCVNVVHEFAAPPLQYHFNLYLESYWYITPMRELENNTLMTIFK